MGLLDFQKLLSLLLLYPLLTACSVSALIESVKLQQESKVGVSIDSQSYDFGKLDIAGGTNEKIILLDNSSNEKISNISASIDFSSVSLASTPFRFKGGVYPGTGGDCSDELDVDSQCQVVVVYDPSVVQADSGSIEFTYTIKQISGSIEASLLGIGVNPALLSISDGLSYDFGSVLVGSSSSAKTFTVTNSGGEATAVMESSLTLPFAYEGFSYPGTGGTCGTVISAGGSCTLVIKFSPIISGATSGRIELSYNDGLVMKSTDRDIEGVGLNPNVAPVATAQTLSDVLAETGTVITLAGTDANGDTLTYALVSGPSHGVLTGTIPNYLYTPTAGYTGSDSFTFKVNDGTLDSATATVSITVVAHVIYLRTSGHNGTAVVNDPTFPFRTAQAVADVIVGRSTTVPTVVDVGTGNFGDIRLNSNFGSNVSWRGVSRTDSIIGNIDASGNAGADGYDDGMGYLNYAQSGANGYDVFIYSEANVKFGTIIANGGNGGNGAASSSYPHGANGGTGGQIVIGPNVETGTLVMNGGSGGAGDSIYGGNNGLQGLGGRATVSGKVAGIVSSRATQTVKSGGDTGNIIVTGGTVNIEAGGQAASVTTHGIGELNISGGTVTVYGTVTGNISSNGGDEGSSISGYYPGSSGGNITIEATGVVGGGVEARGGVGNNRGGYIIVKGSVAGQVLALGGSDGSGFGGSGGEVNVWSGGSATGGISVSGSDGASGGGDAGIVTISGTVGAVTAIGGYNTSFGYGGAGGTITLNAGADVASITAFGGGANMASPGVGGSVTVNTGAVCRGLIHVDGGSAMSSPGPGANGGTITVAAGATVGNLAARGGSSYGSPGSAGAGGNVTLDPAAISYNHPSPISIFDYPGDDY